MSKIAIKDLAQGTMVDLEGDRFADPKRSHQSLEFEYAVVTAVEVETLDCTRVDFDNVGLCVGFPPEHMVSVEGESA